MNELIKVNYDAENPTVSARELHEYLGVKSKYADWFKNMCAYGFEENADFTSFSKNLESGGRRIEHFVSIDCAKEICMLQRNDKGKQARQYFIGLERSWNSPEQVMARALKLADKQIHNLKGINHSQAKVIDEMKPKALFADAVSTSKTSILIGEMAKILKQNGFDIGQNRLFKLLRDDGYLIKRNGTDYNMPTQYSMERELFEVKETSITHADGHVTISKTPKVTGKGQVYFINKYSVYLPNKSNYTM